jgi:hypothetical protein
MVDHRARDVAGKCEAAMQVVQRDQAIRVVLVGEATAEHARPCSTGVPAESLLGDAALTQLRSIMRPGTLEVLLLDATGRYIFGGRSHEDVVAAGLFARMP